MAEKFAQTADWGRVKAAVAGVLLASALAGCSTPGEVSSLSPEIGAAGGVIAPSATGEPPRVMTASAPTELKPEAAVQTASIPAVAPTSPTPAVAAVTAAPVATASVPKVSAYSRSGYPNINITPPAADVALMSPAERAKIEGELRNLSSAHAQASGTLTPQHKAEIEAALEKLAEQHRREAAKIAASQ